MPRDSERIQRISDALQEANLDALVCALPVNVLMLTGYWPVVGTSIAIVVRDSRVIIMAPEDELQIAASGGADEVKSFKAGSLIDLLTVADAIHDPFRDVINRLGLSEARIGYEYGVVSQPLTYAAMHLYGCQLHDLLKDACATATLCPADDLLTRQRAVKTSFEISRIRTACVVARKAFLQ